MSHRPPSPPAPALRRHRLLVLGLVVALLGLAAYPTYRHFVPDLGSCTPSEPAATVDGLVGTMTGDGPWTRNCRDLPARLAALKLPPYDPQERVHRHAHLDLFVDGDRVDVPAGIGLDADDVPVSPVHTHNADGIVHVESPVERDYTLADFFRVWGLRADGGCLGGRCASGDRALHVFVDGAEVAADPARVQLLDQRQVVVSYGTRAEVDRQVPDSFTDWPPV